MPHNGRSQPPYNSIIEFYEKTSKGPSLSHLTLLSNKTWHIIVTRSGLSLLAAGLRCWSILLWGLGETDSTGARDGSRAQVGTVARLCDLVGDGLESPERKFCQHFSLYFERPSGATHFLVLLFPLKVVLWMAAAGLWGCLVVLVIRVTPPLSPSAGTIETACPTINNCSHSSSPNNSLLPYLVVDESRLLYMY